MGLPLAGMLLMWLVLKALGKVTNSGMILTKVRRNRKGEVEPHVIKYQGR